MATYLVTGASRGIGRELVAQLAARGEQVIATVREPAKATDFPAGVRVLPLEVTDQASIDALASTLAGTPIDVLINNAGVSSTSKSLATTDAAELARCFAVNATAPIMVAKALLGSVRQGRTKLIANVSTQLASITNNSGGSTFGYRASKTALNQLTVCMANELKADGICCVVFHPGWVQTDMGGPQAPLTPAHAVRYILGTLDRLSISDSGRFMNYDGKPMPW